MMRLTRLLIPMVTFACFAGLVSGPAQAVPTAPPRAVPQVTRTLELRLPSSLGSRWARVARIGYGTSPRKLGTSPGGENLMIGPSYGVQVPNRSWWYLDAAKLRLAHYSNSGTYLGQVKVPRKYLVRGAFQWVNPIALADGTVVASSDSIDSPALLLMSPSHRFNRVRLNRFVNVVVTDGHSLYGFDENGKSVRVKPRTGTITTVTNFKGQGGRTFRISIGTSRINVVRPGVNLRLNLVDPAHPGLPVYPRVEAAMGADGKLWILATGVVEVTPTEAHDVIGLFTVSRSGAVSAVEPVRTPYSDSDPGDGHRLGIRLGASRPWLMFIDTDAVRVYRKK